jgi:CelD/BcsL family acetyltransferase involved in cellulose biosynthesis
MSEGAPGPMTMPTQVRLEGVPSLDALGDEWGELARASGNIFSTWEWASTWWRHQGSKRAPLVFACRAADDRLAAVLPLYLWSARPLRVARFIGHGPADQLGPICPPSGRVLAAEALRGACEDARLDALLAELLPGGAGWDSALDAKPLRQESSPILSLAEGWEAYLAARSANFRQQIRRRER